MEANASKWGTFPGNIPGSTTPFLSLVFVALAGEHFFQRIDPRREKMSSTLPGRRNLSPCEFHGAIAESGLCLVTHAFR
ncbi:MAG: hypothetical protein ACQ9MH_15330 [Nitrospinales bacterium]